MIQNDPLISSCSIALTLNVSNWLAKRNSSRIRKKDVIYFRDAC